MRERQDDLDSFGCADGCCESPSCIVCWKLECLRSDLARVIAERDEAVAKLNGTSGVLGSALWSMEAVIDERDQARAEAKRVRVPSEVAATLLRLIEFARRWENLSPPWEAKLDNAEAWLATLEAERETR